MKKNLLIYFLFVFFVSNVDLFSQTTSSDTNSTLTDIDTDGDGISDQNDSDANGDGVADWIANSGLTDKN